MSSAGAEAVELAAMAGLELDPWQQFVLEQSLGERSDGTWAASRVGLVVPRQNGKGSVLEARELAGLFLLGERLIVHSAHEFATSLEAFRRLESLIQNTPEFHKRVKPNGYKHSHGEEGIEFRNGQRIRFRTRTKGGGRGFTGDCLILDEAMILPEAMLAALLPTLSARPNPQVWYTGSAVDQTIHEDGLVLTRIRERGHNGTNPRLAYFEWSLDADSPDAVTPADLTDPDAWAEANPGYGIRIAEESIVDERGDLDPRSFAVERLGVGDWPLLDGANGVISLEKWLALTDPQSRFDGAPCFALDVSPDRAWATIAAAGIRPDGLSHLEIVDRQRGTGWVVDRLVALKKHKPKVVACDASGPAASLLPELERAGVEVVTVNAKEHAQACGVIYDMVEEAGLRHLGTPELDAAIRGAKKRPLADAWAWSRKSSAVDISPLVAGTLAVWASATAPSKREPLISWA